MRTLLPLLALALAACDGGSAFSGPVEMGIDPATNHQQARAAEADSLPKTVDAVLWRGRGADGRVSFRLVTPAYAQTAVDGAPVPGALVNAVGVGDCPLHAWNPAAVTDADGKARFWFEPGTKSGECLAEIRYADESTRLVTDTAVAIVEPGPYEGGYRYTSNTIRDSVVVLSEDLVRDRYGNPIPFRVEAAAGDTLILPAGGEVGTEAGRTFVWHWHPSAKPTWENHFDAVLADGTAVPVQYRSGGGVAELEYRIEG